MDKIEKYRQLLEEVILRHAKFRPSYGQIETAPIIDCHHDHYLLMDFGWDRNGRVHAVAFHARIQNNKIWIEWDGTEPSITEELVDHGIPRNDIVLGFYRPEHRVITDFAVA